MAVKTIIKGTEEWEMFKDFWNLYKNYGMPEETEEYWRALVIDIGKFVNKYNNSFSKHLTLALYSELEEQWKKGRD